MDNHHRLVERLHQKVVGQKHAVSAVADVVMVSKAGLGSKERPQSFFFLGPTGVGKTMLAKALAEELSDDAPVITIVMSVYMDQHSVARSILAPSGYVGHEGEQLTEGARRRPYAVLLFDKVERAHPSVFSTLLWVLDHGWLPDGQGGIADFTNTVIIVTSNLEAEWRELTGKCSMDGAPEMVMEEEKKKKLLCRLGEIVVFDPLSDDQLRKVCQLQMKDVANRLAKRGIAVGITEAALDIVATKSHEPVYGAWPIVRWLEKHVVTELAKMILRDEIGKDSTVNIDASLDGEALTYRVEMNGGLVNATTVYIDASLDGEDLTYLVERNGGLVNATTGQQSDVLIHGNDFADAYAPYQFYCRN